MLEGALLGVIEVDVCCAKVDRVVSVAIFPVMTLIVGICDSATMTRLADLEVGMVTAGAEEVEEGLVVAAVEMDSCSLVVPACDVSDVSDVWADWDVGAVSEVWVASDVSDGDTVRASEDDSPDKGHHVV